MYLQTQDKMCVYEVDAPISIIKKENLFLLEVRRKNHVNDNLIIGAFDTFEDCEKVMLNIAENMQTYSKNIFKVPTKENVKFNPIQSEPVEVEFQMNEVRKR